MADIEIYTTMLCPFCQRAKNLLAEKGVGFREIDVTFKPKQRKEMSRRANGTRTVPQIFIDGEAIGGSDELAALDAAGRLDDMLGIAS